MKLRVLGIIISILFFLQGAGLFYIQIVKGPFYQRLSTLNRIRLIPIESTRGRIFDRNGTVLVDNRISFNVAIIPQELKNKEGILENLGKRLGIPKDELNHSLKRNFITPFQPVRVTSDIGRDVAIKLEEERLDLPGVIIETTPRRYYPYRETGSHIFGYLGQINPQELTRLKPYGYRRNDFIGKAGIEKSYDNYLKGSYGGMQVEVNNKGYQVGILGIKEPAKGKDLHLTVDIRLQEFIEDILKDAQGAICIMDPRNGEILALVSSPSFDPNIFVDKENFYKIKELFDRKDYPMLNRAVQCAYPPGSVFKVVVSSAALERGRITPHTTLSCSGTYLLGNKEFVCWREEGHGVQKIREAIKNSCNVFFYQVGRRVGADDIANFATRFGFGRPTAVELPGETGGLVPNKMWKALRKREAWYEGETLNYAIGQGYLLVTPLQIVRMTAAVANGGYLLRPYLVKRIEDIDISEAQKKPIKISQETLNIIKDGMVKVINDRDGTGRKAFVEGLKIAGKTGTAQTSEERTHAWFTGFAPADNPKMSLMVFLEYGGKGGLGASKSAGEIFTELKRLGYI